MDIIASKKRATARIVCILVGLVMVGHVSSDIAEDKKECQGQLIGLSPCLNFVSGDSKAPTPACCSELKKDYNKTKRCLCILIKDRNEPGLGLKINATLALSLPFICHVPANTSDCLNLLHLDPNSTDAQVFEQFATTSASDSNNTVIGEISASSSSTVKGRWAELGRVGKVSLSLWLLLISVFFIGRV